MEIKLRYLILFLTINSFAQDRLMTSKGVINFEASVPFFEEVKAHNEDVICILNPKKSELTCTVIIKKFQFKRDLMYEHFNDNYMESNRYSKATFKGVIDKFDLKNITTTPIEYRIIGKIEIHGHAKKINVIAKISRVSDGIQIISSFTLNTDDFKIKIPSLVITKVSKNVNTNMDFIMN